MKFFALENMKQIRQEKGFTQQDIANAIGVSQNAIYNWETGKREPPIDTIEKIANALGVSPVYLIWGSDANEWQELINTEDAIKEESSETLNELFSLIKKIITENDKNDIFTELPEEWLLYYFWLLNNNGQKKAIEQVELLTKIPEYRKDE